MFILVLLCLMETCLSQEKVQQYFEVTGLQDFDIKEIFSKNLSEKQKVTFTLFQEDGEIPILIICDNQPPIKTLSNYDSIQNENCICDINAYDQKFNTQSISLIKNVKSQTFQKRFNIYQMQNQNMFVGAYSKSQSTYLMSAVVQSLYNCGKECKNGGSCFYGICECQEGTFGDDCSIIGIDIIDQIKLQIIFSKFGLNRSKLLKIFIKLNIDLLINLPNLIIERVLFYYNKIFQYFHSIWVYINFLFTQPINNSQVSLIKKIKTTLNQIKFIFLFLLTIPLKQQCYTEKPFIDQGSLLITNLLQLNYDQIQNCRNLTKALQDEIKLKQKAYFTFKIYSQNDVNILINNNNDDGLQKIMMMIFIPFCVVFFFLLLCCCVKFYRKKLEQTQIHKNVEQEIEASFINQYMPNLKFQQIKEIIQEDFNEQESYCSICLEKFTLQNDVRVTYCKHIYHSKCLSMWIKKIKICPLCRAPLDEKTLASLVHLKSQTIIDQISSKSQSENNKLKIFSLNSLSSLNGPNTQNAFQHLNYQRSLVLVEQ